MTFLLISIVGAFLNAAQIKHYEIQGWDARVVITANYISASLLGWIFYAYSEDHQIDATTIWLGVGGGILWPSTFLILMQGIRDYGLSLAGSSSRLSLLVPVLFAVVFLDEILTFNTLIGILLALAALILMSKLKKADSGKLDLRALWFIPLMVFSLGCVNLWLNIFNHYGTPSQHHAFITLVFSFSPSFLHRISLWVSDSSQQRGHHAWNSVRILQLLHVFLSASGTPS
ncbi:MAG: hypothetical protein ACJ0DH_10640 [bacterium]